MDELREFVADRAKESGDRDAWLALQFDQATDRITLDKYKKFKAMCTAEEWEQFEPGVLKKLKDAGSTEKLKIYMDRKEYEKVISLLEKDRYPIYDWDSHTIVKIASKLEKRYPEKILKWYLSGLGNLYDAKELFVDYAFRCSDKDKIADIILKVNQKDYYGIRDTLIDCAGECLPEDVIRTMIATLQKWAGKAKDEYGKRHHLRSIESLARQIKDAKLFEKTRIASWGKLSTAALIDIARVYLESGDVETAHSWLKKIPEGETYQAYERDKLLEEIYQKQGDSEKLTELLFQKFRSYQSTDTLQALLDVIGHDKRDDVISDETRQILKTERLRESDAEFLISIGKIDEAEQYLLKRAEQLDGNHYGSLLSLAKALEAENRHLVTSLMYRSLLLSILERGYTKAYSHGIRYLKKLDKLATNVDDWKEFNHHEAFKEQVIEAHGRKRSFWSKYEVKK